MCIISLQMEYLLYAPNCIDKLYPGDYKSQDEYVACAYQRSKVAFWILIGIVSIIVVGFVLYLSFKRITTSSRLMGIVYCIIGAGIVIGLLGFLPLSISRWMAKRRYQAYVAYCDGKVDEDCYNRWKSDQTLQATTNIASAQRTQAFAQVAGATALTAGVVKSIF